MQLTAKSVYGDVRVTNMDFDRAIAQVETALKNEGFGILCQIDVQAKLKEKLGVEFSRYEILGACNPPAAHQALQNDINLGLLLPCNVVVYEQNGKTFVGAIDAVKMLSITGHPELEGLARQVNQKLVRALEAAAGNAGSLRSGVAE